MRTIHVYGLSTLLMIVGVMLWLIQAQLIILAWCAISGGALWFAGSLWKHFMPAIESSVHTRLAVSAQEYDQWARTIDKQMEYELVKNAIRTGKDVEKHEKGGLTIKTPARAPQVQVSEVQEPLEIAAPMSIPDFVRYDAIRSQIPQQHVLIGVGEGGALDTREKEVKGLTWIVGSSGAGKSNTTGIRVDEDYERGHKFLGIDPHFFKKDSLSNLVAGYMDQFIEPMAHTDESILHVLDLFIDEVERRKQGAPCWPLTLLIDEIGSLTADKPTDKQEEAIINKIKKCARLAGQETRGFNMNLIAISQDAAGLAWLRKRALLVIGHKVTMMSERQLVCNERGDIAREMDMWPVGRTVVYGVALQGIFIRQQPLFVPRNGGNSARNSMRNTGVLFNSPTIPNLSKNGQDRLANTPPHGMPAISLAQEDFFSEREEKITATPEERALIVELARAGTPRRKICYGLGKGKWFYPAVRQVLDEEGL